MVLIAHVLCTGPSLSRTWRRVGFGPVIGVNRAVDFTACDWLVAGDAVTFTRIRGKPLRGVVSFNDNLREYVPKRWQPLELIAWQDLPHPPGRQAQWGIEAAMLLARHLAGTQLLDIVIFGCDRDAAKPNDWDGTTPSDPRDQDRWDRETRDYESTVNHLETNTRTRVTRITP